MNYNKLTNNAPDYPDEECMGDGYLPDGRNLDGSESLPITEEGEQACRGLSAFFAGAWIH